MVQLFSHFISCLRDELLTCVDYLVCLGSIQTIQNYWKLHQPWFDSCSRIIKTRFQHVIPAKYSCVLLTTNPTSITTSITFIVVTVSICERSSDSVRHRVRLYCYCSSSRYLYVTWWTVNPWLEISSESTLKKTLDVLKKTFCKYQDSREKNRVVKICIYFP